MISVKAFVVSQALRFRARRFALLVVVALGAVAIEPMELDSATAAGPPGLSVSGNQLLKDGDPYIPQGFNMVALLTPSWCTRTQTAPATANFNQAEMDLAKTWKVTALRFQISQEGLTGPAVSQSSRDAYLERVRAGVALARSNGFDVIVSMQDQYFSCGLVHPLPSSQTVEAWNLLAPMFQADPYVMFELFNEPDVDNDAAGWQQWKHGGTTPSANLGTPAVGQQELLDQIRALGITNVVIADAADKAAKTAGMPLLNDPAGNLMYGIHPYNFSGGVSWWDAQYGAYSGSVPLIATEWNYKADKCGTASEALAPALLQYLYAHRIGLFGHAFDMTGTIVADLAGTPTECGSAVGGSGRVLKDFFVGEKGPDTTPPGVPGNLRASATSVTQRERRMGPQLGQPRRGGLHPASQRTGLAPSVNDLGCGCRTAGEHDVRLCGACCRRGGKPGRMESVGHGHDTSARRHDQSEHSDGALDADRESVECPSQVATEHRRCRRGGIRNHPQRCITRDRGRPDIQ